MALILFFRVFILFEIAIKIRGLCDIEAAGYGHDDNPSYLATFKVYFKLNGYFQHAVVDHPAKRGIHLGLVNISNCLLVQKPSICDTDLMTEGNMCLNSIMESYRNDDKDLIIILTTGLCVILICYLSLKVILCYIYF